MQNQNNEQIIREVKDAQGNVVGLEIVTQVQQQITRGGDGFKATELEEY